MAEVPISQNATAQQHLWLQQGDTGDETKDEPTPELMLKLSTIEALKFFIIAHYAMFGFWLVQGRREEERKNRSV